jgi:hypothetical protein
MSSPPSLIKKKIDMNIIQVDIFNPNNNPNNTNQPITLKDGITKWNYFNIRGKEDRGEE